MVLINQNFGKIEGPCPFADSGRYKFQIKAVNENGVVIGIGSKKRYFPEKKNTVTPQFFC